MISASIRNRGGFSRRRHDGQDPLERHLQVQISVACHEDLAQAAAIVRPQHHGIARQWPSITG